MTLPFHLTTAMVAGALSFAFGAADLWYFHALPHDTSLNFIWLGLTAIGLTSAYTAGLHSDPAPTPTPVPVAPKPLPVAPPLPPPVA